MSSFYELPADVREAYVDYTRSLIDTAAPTRYQIEAAYEGDLEDFADFGRYPEGSPLAGSAARSSRRMAAVQRLVEQGATEGEREAARAALERMRGDDQGFAVSSSGDDQGFAA